MSSSGSPPLSLSLSLSGLFGAHPPDSSERLIAALEYIALVDNCLGTDRQLPETAALCRIAEKGASYRGMFASVPIDSLSLDKQVDLVLGSFSEFEDACVLVPDCLVELARLSAEAAFVAVEECVTRFFDAAGELFSTDEQRDVSGMHFVLRLETDLLVLTVSSSSVLHSFKISDGVVLTTEPTSQQLLGLIASSLRRTRTKSQSEDQFQPVRCEMVCVLGRSSNSQSNHARALKMRQFLQGVRRAEKLEFILCLEREKERVLDALLRLPPGSSSNLTSSPEHLALYEQPVSTLDGDAAPADEEEDRQLETAVPAPDPVSSDAGDYESDAPDADARVDIGGQCQALTVTADLSSGVHWMNDSLRNELLLSFDDDESAEGLASRAYMAIRDKALLRLEVLDADDSEPATESETERDGGQEDEHADDIVSSSEEAVSAAVAHDQHDGLASLSRVSIDEPRLLPSSGWDYSPVRSPDGRHSSGQQHQERKRLVAEAARAIEVALSTNAFIPSSHASIAMAAADDPVASNDLVGISAHLGEVVHEESVEPQPVPQPVRGVWSDLRDRGVLPKALQPRPAPKADEPLLSSEVLGLLHKARHEIEARGKADLREKLRAQRVVCAQIAAVFTKKGAKSADTVERRSTAPSTDESKFEPAAVPESYHSSFPSVQELRTVSAAVAAVAVSRQDCSPRDVGRESTVRKSRQSLSEYVSQAKSERGVPESVSTVQTSTGAPHKAKREAVVKSQASGDSINANRSNSTATTKPKSAQKEDREASKDEHKPVATKFEISFLEEGEAKLLAMRREAKIFALQKKSDESHVRSNSAGVFRRRSEGGHVDSLEERSVASASTAKKKGLVGDGASTRSTASARPQPAAIPAQERGYLYYHDLAQQKPGKVTADPSVIPLVEEEKSSSRVQETGRDQRPTAVPVSPVASVGSKRRAQSAGRVRGTSSKLSNVQQVRNALAYVCLAGVHLETTRNEALLLIDQYSRGGLVVNAEEQLSEPVVQFVIMLAHSKTLAFRALYIVHPLRGELMRVLGKGPRLLQETQVEEYFKFETSSRSFAKLASRTFTATTDAVSVDTAKILLKNK